MGWRRFLLRARWDRERAEELQSYLQIETDENIARGMTAEEARRAAQRKLGNALLIREEIYHMNTIGFLDSVGRDLRYALRGMRRRLAFTLAAVLTLALGIGANTAIFSVVYGVLIKPLPYPNADELVGIWHTAPGLQAEDINASPSMYFTYRDENRTFQNIGLWSAGGQSVTGLGEPEQARTLWVTYGTLQALGVEPVLGRWFSEADDTPGSPGPDPVILSYGYWQRRFGGENSIISRKLTIDARPSEVIGVMPARFRFLDLDPQPDLILTQRFNRSRVVLGTGSFRGIARLKPGATLAEANADIQRMLPIWLNAWPTPAGPGRQLFESWKIGAALRPLKNEVVGSVADMLWVLMGTIGIVLLIACANIGNLMLVSADGRRQEFAVRAALGAGRSRIAEELLVESLALGAMGGALGIALASGGLKLLIALGPTNLPRLQEISIDPIVLAFAAAASLFSSLLFGSIPTMKNTFRIGTPLGSGARGATTSRERHRARNTLVVVQVALALVLLVSAGLLIRTFLALHSITPGFVRPAEIQTARIWIPASQAREPERYTRMQHDILDKIAAIPGVSAVAISGSVPMDGRVVSAPISIEQRPYAYDQMPPNRRHKFVSPGYFQTMGTRMIAGRDITWTDIETGGKVALISESVARELWGGPTAAVGKRIGDPAATRSWREVIGVVEDVHDDGPHQASPATVYWPLMMEDFFGAPKFGTPAIAFVIRSERAGTESLLSDVRQAVWSINANLPVFLVSTMKELYDRSMARTSFALVMLAIAAALALGLGLIGIYGVISYVVSQQSREIGIRLALGAEPVRLKRMFLRHGLTLAVIGVLAGLAMALPLMRFMSSLLFGIGPLDATTYVAVLAILLTAGGLASYMPARRAAALDPVEALKAE
jgi:putative ABC transport system permease protein